MKYSTIRIRGDNQSRKVRITSDLKPQILDSMQNKWQSLIDTAARIVNVPSGLIMRLNEETIEVFLASNTDGNPYEKGEKAELIYGLYCETVIGTQNKLHIPTAIGDTVWEPNNPDVEINMVSYLGFPINWPDGEVFGTVCLLDSKENFFSEEFEALLQQVKDHIEDDLTLIILNETLYQNNIQLEELNNTKSKFLSLISHDIRGNIGSLKSFLEVLVLDFDNYSPDKLKRSLSSLSQLAASSSDTLENLLKWSKEDLSGMKPDISSVDILIVLEDILDFFKNHLTIKGIKIEKAYSNVRAIVETDKNMLSAILRNIISNAIKYTPMNGVVMVNVKNNRNETTIRIKDSGQGMSEDILKNLFKISTNRKNGTMNESGAGIGLYLSQEFAEKIGAKISVKSAPETGSEFTISL